jgi:two-component system response regulator DctR
MNDAIAHVVDDDAAIRDALEWLLKSRGVAARSWESGEAFLGGISQAARGCVVLDVRMEGMSGIEVYDQLVAREIRLPVIFLTGHGEVQMAVDALKRGAFDFVEKPFNDNQLVDRVLEALRFDEVSRRELEAEASVAARLERLTPREREVMELVVSGKLNKQIAAELGTSEKTIKIHRGRIVHKMQADSLPDLVRMAQALDIPSSKS